MVVATKVCQKERDITFPCFNDENVAGKQYLCIKKKRSMINTSAFQGKKAAYYTLGCKLNFSETSTFGKLLSEMGVTTAHEGEHADICLINTCSVTEVADHKCRQAIHRMVRENPDAFVVVTGCYAQLEPETVSAIDGVDLVLGSNEKANLIQYLSDAWTQPREGHLHAFHHEKTKDIKTFQPSCSRGNRTRYFLKVQDGCIGEFGKTTGETFLDLVKALDNVEGIQRYRISSLEPDLIDDKLIEYCAHSRAFMPHFHIPLQSGNDEVLKLMHRRYTRDVFAHKINLIKELMPDAFIGVDVMVGCRGERPEYFEDCYNFLDNLPVTQLHVFPYSERPGTSALAIPYVVSDKDKKERSKWLLELSDKKTHDFYAHYIGQTRPVLFEKAPAGHAMHGFTDNYIRVTLPASEAREEYDNEILNVTLGDFRKSGKENTLLAKAIIAK